MLKIKIASVLVIGSLLLGGCASKSPVNIDNKDKNNTSISQDSKTEQNTTNDNKVVDNQAPVPNPAPETANGQGSPEIKPAPNTGKPVAPPPTKVTTQAQNYNKPKAAPAPQASQPQSGVEYLASVEDEVLRLCNIERSKTGLGPLVMDSKVREAARFKAQEMLTRNYFDHNSPYSGSPFDLMRNRGIQFGYAGENIQKSDGMAKASVTAQYLVTNWMNSPGHRANILKPEFKKMGIGVAFSANGNKADESQLFTD